MKKIAKFLQKFRIFWFKSILSDHKVQTKANILSPTLFLQNDGKINIEGSVTLGYFPSPKFYSGYNHIETRRGGGLT
ncbi:hypothetical protein [Campylobacter sp. MIT 99-7217]|uniref:hypothetical protein n=1 Tax=Campylobacter sp. MIT 99-7217 TaxID=535091 RepID=UPI001C8D0C67|nr:hypothetical protein [Campylobacter sp. MIT 99-7217]